MNKISLIIIREYLSRVKRRSFIVMTILGPILFSALFIVPIWLATQSGTEEKTILILDKQNLFEGKLADENNTQYQFFKGGLEDAKAQLKASFVDALLYIPSIDLDDPTGIRLYATQNPGIALEGNLEWKIRERIEELKLINSGLDQKVLDGLKAHVSLQTINISDQGNEKESSAEGATVVGYIGAFLIYFFIFLYGAQIMRGVIEEKMTRIVEVIIASVRPFQLMMGKIIGVGAVGLTQFALWVIFSIALVSGISMLVLEGADPEQVQQSMMQSNAINLPADESQLALAESLETIFQFDLVLILSCFIFYFLGGYLFYGALFAAVGSAVDTEADSQQFMLPITIPLILSIAMISVVIQEPHGSLAFWLSVLPFSSPVIMMMRLPFDVPAWHLILSIISLIGGFCLTTWVASRIYRVGIFIHGTKVNYKTLAKWLFMK